MGASGRRNLRGGWLAILLGALAALPSQAAETPSAVSPAERQEIQNVIQAQIDAFRRDDAAAAFALASPSIQARFGTAENFLGMVRSGYEPVYRPRHYRFLELVLADGNWVQKVIVIGPDGLAVMALYPMVRLDDGKWRTDGCYLVPLAAKDA